MLQWDCLKETCNGDGGGTVTVTGYGGTVGEFTHNYGVTDKQLLLDRFDSGIYTVTITVLWMWSFNNDDHKQTWYYQRSMVWIV